MKKFSVFFVIFFAVLLCLASLVQAAEQKSIFNTESIEYKSGTGSKRCQEKCTRKSGPDIQSLLSEGWKIVSSSRKKVVEEEYWYVPCNTCEPHGCNCIGTEYVLQKDEPAPIADKTVATADTRDNNQQSEVSAPKGESSITELERLKNESVLLKQEISELKQEIEKLKNQIKSVSAPKSDEP